MDGPDRDSASSQEAITGRRLIDIHPGKVASLREMNQAQLLRLVIRLVQIMFRFDTCAVFSYDDKNRRLVLVDQIGMPAASALGSEFISLDDDPTIHQVVTESKAIVVNTSMSGEQQLLIRSFMAVPIALNDSVVGTLNMSRVSDRGYLDEDLQRLNAVAAQAAVMVQSLRTLTELEVEQREILETVPLPIVRVDFIKKQSVVNAAAQKFFKFDEEKIGLDAFLDQTKRCIDKDISVVLDRIRRKDRNLDGIEVRSVGTDESILNLTVSAILSDDKITGAVLVFEDLTEILRARETAEHNERLAALGELAAGVAHEVKNPLTSIKGFTQLLRGKKTDLPFIDKYVTLVSTEVDRLDRIVDQLLQLARPKSAKLRASDMRLSVTKVMELVMPQMEKKNAKIHPDIPSTPVMVMMDAQQIEQVILNIMLNAAGIIPAKDGTVRVRVQEQGDRVSVVVQDNGPGIPPEHRQKLFHPFFTTRRGGTGLGLAVSHRIITDHGGRILVSSKTGAGATFTIELPRGRIPRGSDS